jgi:hypothetical protein
MGVIAIMVRPGEGKGQRPWANPVDDVGHWGSLAVNATSK